MAGSFPATGAANTPVDPATTNTNTGLTDQQLQQILSSGSAGSPPVVPGYSNSGTGQAGVGMAGGSTISVGSYSVTLSGDVQATDTVPTSGGTPYSAAGFSAAAARNALVDKSSPNTTTVGSLIQGFATWSTTDYNTFKQQAYQAGLTTSANATKADVLSAWQLVVQEAAKENITTSALVTKAVSSGWNGMNPTYVTGDVGAAGTGNAYNAPDSPANQTTQTSYISYMDPATAQGTLADAYYRLLGRMPTSQEYQAFLNSLYGYQGEVNSGTFDTKSTTKSGNAASSTNGPSTVVQNNEVSQKGVGTRGAEFLAGQNAMSDPNYGNYQAATTYWHAFMSALGGPAAGEQAAGPTVTSP